MWDKPKVAQFVAGVWKKTSACDYFETPQISLTIPRLAALWWILKLSITPREHPISNTYTIPREWENRENSSSQRAICRQRQNELPIRTCITESNRSIIKRKQLTFFTKETFSAKVLTWENSFNLKISHFYWVKKYFLTIQTVFCRRKILFPPLEFNK